MVINRKGQSSKKLFSDLVIIKVSPKEITAYDSAMYPIPLWIKTFRQKHTLGWNFMYGVKHTKSKYLMRVDADDDFHPCYKVSYGLNILRFRSDINAVSPFYEIFYNNPDNAGNYTVLNVVTRPQGAGIIYDREAFMDVGGYNSFLKYQSDLDFYIKFTNKYTMGLYPAIYGWRYKDNGSIKHKDDILILRKEILKKYNKMDNDVHHFGMYAYYGG